MLKLTRLNNQVVAINPDHVYAADAAPDTTLRLIGGERIIVRETLDELIERVVEYRRRVRSGEADGFGDARGVAAVTERHAGDSASGGPKGGA